MKRSVPVLLAASAIFLALPAHAQDNSATNDGNWIVRVGGAVVVPTSSTGRLAGLKASVGNDTKLSISLEYLITPNWGVDALGALPFEHEVRLDGMKAATTRQLPPTFGLNYHFMPNAIFSPFVGAGFNYTRFYSTHGAGILSGASVNLENSWGAAAHAGVDVKLADRWRVTADMRWIEIRSGVHVDGDYVGRARIDPFVYGLSVGYQF